jgi:hypothetical protein
VPNISIKYRDWGLRDLGLGVSHLLSSKRVPNISSGTSLGSEEFELRGFAPSEQQTVFQDVDGLPDFTRRK